MKRALDLFGQGIILLGIMCGCTSSGRYEPNAESGTLELNFERVQVSLLLPGGYFSARATQLVSDATYTAQLDFNDQQRSQSIQLDVFGVQGNDLILRLPIDAGMTILEGEALGSLLITAQLREFSGITRVEWSGEIRQQLTPLLSLSSEVVSPQSIATLSGEQFLLSGEGDSLFNLSGRLTRQDGRVEQIELTTPLLLSPVEGGEPDLTNRERTLRWWIPSPVQFGISEGLFEGVATVTNRNYGGLTISEPTPIRFTYSAPYLSSFSPLELSRGQLITIEGGGLIDIIDDQGVGLSSISLSGTLTPFDLNTPSMEYQDFSLEFKRIDGSRVNATLDPALNDSCESTELGGTPGVFEGFVQLSTFWRNDERNAIPLPITFQITPSKQIIYLSFLPAFTDSLRLFGLRNVSALVIDEIIAVVNRDYAEVNLELRTSPPTDYSRFSVVEIGGPDPNARDLFGLDNTSGLDHCNQRLDDELAGRNAESGNSYGGVFVESFLNLSMRRTEGATPLSDPLFDEIFDPVINQPAQQADLTGPRAAQVTRAIQVLGHLVGNTLTHEIGHSLGLPVIPGCGAYHNTDGPRQIMDCGQDRPFLERAGLDPAGPPVWTSENLAYLKKILPR